MPIYTFNALPFQKLAGWRMAGQESFASLDDGVIEHITKARSFDSMTFGSAAWKIDCWCSFDRPR